MAKTTPSKKPAASRTAKAAKQAELLTLPVAEVKAKVAKALTLLAEVDALLDGCVTLTPDERRHSTGRLRDGEDQAMRTVLDAADSRPEYFASLAADDGGSDDARFETGSARDHLDRRAALAPVGVALQPIAQKIDDTLLHLGAKAREVVLPAYAIARIAAVRDARLRSKLAPTIAFYGASSRKKPAKPAK